MVYCINCGDDGGLVGGRTRGGSGSGWKGSNGEVGRNKSDADGGEYEVDGGFLVSAFGVRSESKRSRALSYLSFSS